MGQLRDWWRGRSIKDPVQGTAQIVACSRPGRPAKVSNVVMNLIVSGDGIQPTPVEHECWCRQDQWPQPGMTLPVTFDRNDPTRLKVSFDAIPTHAERIQQQTEAILNGGFAGGVTVGEPVVIDLRGQGDQVDRLERLAALHASGVLTDEEFAAAKAKLLG